MFNSSCLNSLYQITQHGMFNLSYEEKMCIRWPRIRMLGPLDLLTFSRFVHVQSGEIIKRSILAALSSKKSIIDEGMQGHMGMVELYNTAETVSGERNSLVCNCLNGVLMSE